MAFKKGDKKPASSGRKPGTPNKRRTIFESLEEIQTEDGSPVDVVKMLFAGIQTMPPYQQVDAFLELMKFIYPQQKNVEVSTGESGFKIVIEDYSKK